MNFKVKFITKVEGLSSVKFNMDFAFFINKDGKFDIVRVISHDDPCKQYDKQWYSALDENFDPNHIYDYIYNFVKTYKDNAKKISIAEV